MTETPRIQDEQQRIATLLRSLDEPAPESLHRKIESLVASYQSRRLMARSPFRARGGFPAWGLAGTGVVAAVVATAVIAVGINPGGSTSAISFGQASASTFRAATLPAPSESPSHHAHLALAVNGVSFPYWDESFGWRSTGARTDRVDGRLITTVFYSDSSGRRIGYAILGGTPAPRIGGGTIVSRHGVNYRLLSENGAAVVTWLRDGHLCVISGRGVSSATLLQLASAHATAS
jgi:hypothetical protein